MEWLVVIGEADALRWVLEEKRMAFRSGVNCEAIQAGDHFALYVTRGAYHNPTRDESQIVAIGKFEGSVASTAVTVCDEKFPKSVPLNFSVVLPERGTGLPFRSLVRRLGFIKKKQNWNAYVRKSLVAIPTSDFEHIRSCLDELVLEVRPTWAIS